MTGSSELRDVSGLRIGHWTDTDAKTGCTVLRFDEPALTAVEVRGAAPGTRELDLLAPGRLVQRSDAILLTGGSAFGLAAADGVVNLLAATGRGFPTPAGPVPIVPSAVIFDLAVGDPVSPNAEAGRIATERADALSRIAVGNVGAGTGATFGNIRGVDSVRRGGFGVAQVALEDALVTACVVFNAWGDARGDRDDDPRVDFLRSSGRDAQFGQSTTLIAVIVDGVADHATLQRCCIAAHDGLARRVVPAHTLIDGDVAFASSIRSGPCPMATTMRFTVATELAVESALESIIARA